MGLAAVFAGLFALMAVLGFVYNPLLLVLAIPFAVVSYTLWYHASGRLREQVGRRSRANRTRGRREATAGGFGAGPRKGRTGPGEGFRDGSGGSGSGFGSARGFDAGRRDGKRGRARAASTTGLSAAEAADVLGVEPSADGDRVRRAYREKVKEVHPDTEAGDEASFKRVQGAYERLRDDRSR
jgi:DnaJ-domain-containing protein 1